MRLQQPTPLGCTFPSSHTATACDYVKEAAACVCPLSSRQSAVIRSVDAIARESGEFFNCFWFSAVDVVKSGDDAAKRLISACNLRRLAMPDCPILKSTVRAFESEHLREG